jgi:hypothetical protein
VKKGAPSHHAYMTTCGRRAAWQRPKHACWLWKQEDDEEHVSALGAMQLGSAGWTAQQHSERAKLSGVRRQDGKLAAA